MLQSPAQTVDASAVDKNIKSRTQMVRGQHSRRLGVNHEHAGIKLGWTLTSCQGPGSWKKKSTSLAKIAGEGILIQMLCILRCTVTNGCYTYDLLMQERPDKTHKNTAICQRCPEANTRIKNMVHPEGALGKKGATLTYCWRGRGQTKNTKKTTICQKYPEATMHGASWGCTV
jgi:hypothetical protein